VRATNSLKVRLAEKAVIATAVAYCRLIEEAGFVPMPSMIVDSTPSALDFSWHALRAAARSLVEAQKP
jgi:hypothetical protein